MVYVKLSYGPYKAHGVIRHRNERLYGVLTYLNDKHYEVELEPAKELNKCVAEVRHVVVFQCDIRNLLYHMPYQEDPVAMKMINALEMAITRIYSEANVALFHIPRPGRQYVPRPANTKDLLTDSAIQLLFELREASSDSKHSDQPIDKSLSRDYIERVIIDESTAYCRPPTSTPYSSKAYIMLSDSLITNKSSSFN